MRRTIRKLSYYVQAMSIGTFARWLVVQSVRRLMFPEARLSFADWGEDRVLTHMLPKAGVYVDVGCNHPISNSNTWLLYTLGWSGICIDGNGDLIELFRRTRPRDTAICALVSDLEKEVQYTRFANSLVSSIDAAHVQEWRHGTAVVAVEQRRTHTLTEILRAAGAPPRFDLLSVDVEGHDFNVLRSLDMDAYRPTVIVVEMHGLDLTQAHEHPVVRYLHDRGYRLIGYLVWNAWFKLQPP